MSLPLTKSLQLPSDKAADPVLSVSSSSLLVAMHPWTETTCCPFHSNNVAI